MRANEGFGTLGVRQGIINTANEPMPSYPPIDKPAPTPVEYVQTWIKTFGSFVGGKIEKARLMTRDDLIKKDAEFLLSNGITQKQIATQYQIPMGSITTVFRKLDVDMDVFQKATEPTSDMPLPKPQITPVTQFIKTIQLSNSKPVEIDQFKITEPDIEPAAKPEIWFTGERTYSGRKDLITSVRVTKSKVVFSAKFGFNFKDSDLVQFGITKDNVIKVKTASSGYKFHKRKKNKEVKAKTLCCSELARCLIERGINLPAVFEMNLIENIWEGELQHDQEARK